MTTDCLSEPRERTETADTAGEGHRAHEAERPATTVPVMPLWERLHTGVRG
ncbi:hypothetical protein [Streptomyces sp. ALI-76-A]|jgi:hypothetical protein|uniref:hypothetical protein n=1 Tax=Streptomyces sp. ALI-76-A TaxID=3025736 RepID=UPI00256EAEDF|nr:hypothetical protein [Streptomyces sp. ALI-76-A]MDL5203344.1 hypothetical protein [Streptomyces sp. ALI-76-A]